MTPVQSMRIIRRLIGIDLSTAMIYRGEFLIWMLSTVAGPVISLLIWRTALTSGANLPVDAEYLTTYFVLLGVVSMLTSSWISGFLAKEIREGTLSKWIVRPGSTHLNGIANNLSEKIIKSVVLTPLIAVIWWVFRDAIVVPSDPLRWFLFVLGVVGGAVMVYATHVMTGALAFWFDDVTGIDRARDMIAAVLSGAIVPLALMPDWAQGFVTLQPFRYTLSFPIELVIGDLTRAEQVTGMLLQIAYPVIFVAGAMALWRRGMRAYAAVGA